MDTSFEFLLGALKKAKEQAETKPEGEVITVSETVSVAASVYETIRNTLEYDEEHLLRRNAIRRILNRRLGEVTSEVLAGDLMRELIWARYLPNKTVAETMIGTVAVVVEKYQSLFSCVDGSTKEGQHKYEWLLDVASTELEYTVVPPIADEALASFAYAQLKSRLSWSSPVIVEEDRDLQLYIAVHRAVLKSNIATLRFRVLSLFYPEWTRMQAKSEELNSICQSIPQTIERIEQHLRHPGQDTLFMLVRRHAVVFHVIRDISEEQGAGMTKMVAEHNTLALDGFIASAAGLRYDRFRVRLKNSVFRAVTFLFITKMMLALLIEAPYERLVLKTTEITPLLVNIIFHPTLLGVIGLTARLPEAANTEAIIKEAHAFLGIGEEIGFTYKLRRPWAQGMLGIIFNTMYAVVFFGMVFAISSILHRFDFNSLSIVFFIFFLSLVTFFGLKIRNTRRELMVVETSTGFFGTIGDILFLPIVRSGRWIALRAPRINVFIFFFDFIIEAPFKAAISMVEGWLAFLKEKKEEI